jgi:hypothetical protein
MLKISCHKASVSLKQPTNNRHPFIRHGPTLSRKIKRLSICSLMLIRATRWTLLGLLHTTDFTLALLLPGQYKADSNLNKAMLGSYKHAA